jgi:tetratricopeptide (TPR) repeat protein
VRKKYALLAIVMLLLIGCLSKDKVKDTKAKDFELWLVDAQEFTNKGKYQKAIDILNESVKLFGEQELITITYNIAFNYYKLKNFDESKAYLNRVRTIFEGSDLSQAQIQEYRKFVVLSDVLQAKMDEYKESKKDPYHVKEEVENKKIQAKKK